jgi:hypothetical protein
MAVRTIVNAAARALARALTAWLRPGTVPELEQSAWHRGAIDTRRWANESAIPFTLWLALPGGAAAAAATLLATDKSVLLQICAGAFGALAGALVGVFAVLVVATTSAPVRQRDEARTRLRVDGHDPLSKLAQDLEAFAIASRAKSPRSGVTVFMETMGMDRSDRTRFISERNAEVDRAMRDVRGEYHDTFRARVLAELRKPGREALLRAHGEIASDPVGLGAIEKLSRTIWRLARAQTERPGVLESTDEATRTALADDMRQIAGEMEAYLDARDEEATAIEQQMLRRLEGSPTTAADRHDIEQRLDTHRRQTEAAFYLEFRERALELFDRAAATGLVADEERARIEHPRGELKPIGEWLRDLAADLDGQSS